MGELEFRLGNNERARGLYERAQQLYQKTGDDYSLAHCYHFQAELEVFLEEVEKAKDLWTKALGLYEEIGVVNDIAETEVYLAMIDYEQASFESAFARLNRAKEMAASLNNERLNQLIAEAEAEIQKDQEE